MGAQVCSNCGHRLVQSTLAISRGEIDERDCTLRVIPDGGNAFTFALVQTLLNVGSDVDQEIQINEPGIAPYHARLRQEGGNYRLYNIIGTRGVFVNQQPVDNSQVLRDGDTIRLQDTNGRGVTINYSNPVERAMGGSKPVGQNYPFAAFPFTIGRDPASNVALHALAVSWHHAQITENGGQYVLTDLKSTNGTFVNDRQVRGPYRLRPDDVIRIDQVLLVYKGNMLQRLPSLQRFQIDAQGLEMTYRSGVFNRQAKTTMSDVTLAIKPQEFVAVIGGSGSGKSTLLRALNGANRATSGKVLINGDDLYQKYGMFHTLIGYVPQADIVHDALTVYQSLYFGARLRFPNEPHPSREQRITRVLDQLELTDFRAQLVSSLSGGQKKRVSIALELMAEPSLLFMDEPSSGLDPGLDKSMMSTLRRLADRGHVVVVVTHTTLNIDQCDQLALMSRGQLAYFGPPKEALTFFEARDYSEIYNRVLQAPEEVLEAKTGSDTMMYKVPASDSSVARRIEKLSPGEASKRWKERFKTTQIFKNNVTSRLHPPKETEADKESLMASQNLHSHHGTFFQQLQVLTQRTFALVRRDIRTIIALMLVLPLVGLFLGFISGDPVDGGRGKMLISRGDNNDIAALLDKWPTVPFTGQGVNLPGNKDSKFASVPKTIGTFTPAADAQRLLFMMALSVTLVGMFAAAYTIVIEKSLYLRERMVNLRILPYLLSKVIVYGLLAVLSCLIFVVVLSFGVQLPDKGLITWGPLEIFITLVLTSLCGISVGLLLSAVNREINAVTYAMLAILFIQILFPGVLFKMQGALEPLSRLTVTRWALEALGGTSDMITRNSEGRIVVHTQVINVKTGLPLDQQGTQVLPAPPTDSVTYPTSGGELIVRWGVLLGFSIVFLVGATIALNRSESF
jgi:ABC-type multidrug transport system ATPase subunit/pSer/pThr/pTyr-binding forkhead associated (FHA) protein